ncbi:hypothetical protein JHK82_049591 [Glycine max]|uniref:Uncharacterized protein n=1 Tax=Glycine max TaxID=3847 RepID=A0A0R0F8W5_SOYBN|nr:hypothetical protein JHK86_049458 [Glycine max]KAG5090813.1 hypothetical protein JHK82_049591 [Glycine max]KAG5093904.1 hypothetical protein JHK84_049492 [Glycine max]KAH1153592.1 hypothetical protein GYH30_049294 [Glycine max]KRG98387.1 hypothetical protein GLYMA_18G070700v4 [Glycine max]
MFINTSVGMGHGSDSTLHVLASSHHRNTFITVSLMRSKCAPPMLRILQFTPEPIYLSFVFHTHFQYIQSHHHNAG